MKKRIVNLTQHTFSAEQLADLWARGVEIIEFPFDKGLITFDTCPSVDELRARAREVADVAKDYNPTHAMIGGAPYFMPFLEEALWEHVIVSTYAFTERRAVETGNANGSVTKTSVFCHGGWIKL